MLKGKIKGMSEVWEFGELGCDECYVWVLDVKFSDLVDVFLL